MSVELLMVPSGFGVAWYVLGGTYMVHRSAHTGVALPAKGFNK